MIFPCSSNLLYYAAVFPAIPLPAIPRRRSCRRSGNSQSKPSWTARRFAANQEACSRIHHVGLRPRLQRGRGRLDLARVRVIVGVRDEVFYSTLVFLPGDRLAVRDGLLLVIRDLGHERLWGVAGKTEHALGGSQTCAIRVTLHNAALRASDDTAATVRTHRNCTGGDNVPFWSEYLVALVLQKSQNRTPLEAIKEVTHPFLRPSPNKLKTVCHYSSLPTKKSKNNPHKLF